MFYYIKLKKFVRKPKSLSGVKEDKIIWNLVVSFKRIDETRPGKEGVVTGDKKLPIQRHKNSHILKAHSNAQMYPPRVRER